MPLTPAQLREMDGKPVVVVTHAQVAVSIGVLRLSEASVADAAPRLELHFETEAMRCIMRVPTNRVEDIATSWNDGLYRYILPAGDSVWLPREEARQNVTPTGGAPLIETFPLPTDTRANVRANNSGH